MFNNISILLKVCVILINANNIFGSPTTSDYINEDDVINYINGIKEKIDISADPCDNFEKYACGHMESADKIPPLFNVDQLSLIETMFPDGYNIENLIEKLFINGTPKTKYEEIVKDFYKDYNRYMKEETTTDKIKSMFKQVDILKSYKLFPVEKNVSITVKEISELEGILNAFGQGVLINIRPQNEGKIYTIFRNRLEWSKFNDTSDLISTCLASKYPHETDPKEITKIYDFVKKYEIIISKIKEKNFVEPLLVIESMKEIKEKIQIKNFDWSVFEQSLKKSLFIEDRQIEFGFQLENDDFLKEFINLYDSTDINTILNVQILQLISFLLEQFEPKLIVEFGRLAILNRVWTDNLNSVATIERYKTFLTDFKYNLESASELHNFDEEYGDELIAAIRHVLDDHSKIITEEKLENYYKNYKNGEFYENLIFYFRRIIGNIFNHVTGGPILDDLLLGRYDHTIEFDIKNKPYLYYYYEISYKLWYQFFRKNKIIKSTISIKECLNKFDSNDISDYDIKMFVATYASIKSYMNGTFTKNPLSKELKILDNLLESRKLYFLSIAQRLCRYDYIDKRIRSFSAIESTTEFKETFACSDKNSKINQYTNENCKIEECDSDFKNIENLIPYKITECSKKH